MNIDDHPQIAGQLGIQSIPAVIAFKDGQPLDGFMGALPESQVTAFIERVAGPVGPSDAERGARGRGRGARRQGLCRRRRPLQRRAAGRPGQHDGARRARPLLRRAGRAGAGARAARRADARAGEGRRRSPARAPRSSLPRRRRALGQPADLARRLEADPNDHQARFDLALALNAQGDRAGAAEQLLEIVRRNRGWNEEAARKQLVQFFEAWGAQGSRRDRRAGSACRRCFSPKIDRAASGGESRWPSWLATGATRRPADLPRSRSRVSAVRRAAPAERPAAAQHLRAALSRHGRRGDRRRPADRHDPAGASTPPRPRTRPPLCEIGCLGRITQFSETGDGRYRDRALRRQPLPRRRGARRRHALSASAASRSTASPI